MGAALQDTTGNCRISRVNLSFLEFCVTSVSQGEFAPSRNFFFIFRRRIVSKLIDGLKKVGPGLPVTGTTLVQAQIYFVSRCVRCVFVPLYMRRRLSEQNIAEVLRSGVVYGQARPLSNR